MKRSAVISECGAYRYVLGRDWDIARPLLGFIMLNPSTADADIDDPTIRKCIGFSERLGFGALRVVNLFAFRATKPAALKAAGYPVGPDNDTHTWGTLAACDTIVCAWGVNARNLSRPQEVVSSLRAMRRTPKALKLTEDGIPCHPLMLPYTCTLTEYSNAT